MKLSELIQHIRETVERSEVLDCNGSVIYDDDLDDPNIIPDIEAVYKPDQPEPLANNPIFAGTNCNWRSSFSRVADHEEEYYIVGEIVADDLVFYVVAPLIS